MSEAVVERAMVPLIRGMPPHTNAHPFAPRLLGALCGAVALCAASPIPARGQAPGIDSLVAADRRLAALAGAGIAALATEGTPDVVLLYPGKQIRGGRDGVRHLLDSVAAISRDRLTWSPARMEISSDGVRGYAYGRGTRTSVIDGRDSTTGIRYVAWWRRDDSGTWRPAAWLLIDERSDAGHDGAAVTSWRCRTPEPMRSASLVSVHDATAEVFAADSAFASRSAVVGAAVAFAEYVADDGVSIGAAGAPACGKREVGAQLDGVTPSDLAWSPIVSDASGNLGYTIGTATIRGGRGVHFSKYLTVWKRQPDGPWRFVVDGGNAAPARLATFTAHR